MVVGRAHARPVVAVRVVLRHRLGRRPAAAPDPGCGGGPRRRGEGARRAAHPLRRRHRAALLRARLPRGAGHRRGICAGGARPPALPADVVEARRGGADLSPVLRRVHPRRGAGGRPRGVRGDARRGAALGGGRRRRRAARRPPGRPVRPRRLHAPPAGGDRARPLAAGGEDPRRRRGAARLVAGRRHVRLRGTARDLRGVRRRRRGGAAHPAHGRAHRAQGERARRRARRPARGGRHDPGRGGAPHRRAGAGARRGPVHRRGAGARCGPGARSRRRAALRLPGVPQLPAGRALRARHGGVGGDRAPPRSRRRRRGDLRDDGRRPGGRAGHPDPADVRHGDGQGRRRHHVLPLQPVRRAERGGRRPGPVRRLPRRVPRPLRRPGGLVARAR